MEATTRIIDQQLRRRAAAVIPQGARPQTIYGHMSTGRLPESYPQFFARSEGAHVWDVDGNRYLDLMCSYGPNLLGYGHETIDEAYSVQLKAGDLGPGPHPVMVDLAEQFVSQVSHAAWAMFCKNGTDTTTMALMVARAHTGKRGVIRCQGSYHGAAPWCTPIPSGTIPEDYAYHQYCEYNNIASFEKALAVLGDDLACVFATPFRHDAFRDQEDTDRVFVQRLRTACNERGAILILDDVRAGLRISRDCSWSSVNVHPDLSCWGKCIANGHPISALLGSENLRGAASSIYVTGSFWYAAAPMAAAIETLRLVRSTDYLERIFQLGHQLRRGLAAAAEKYGVGFRQTGPASMPLFLFDNDPTCQVGFAWSEEMLRRGIYVHPWHNMFLCAAMSTADIEEVIGAADESFAVLNRGALASSHVRAQG
jgi:glutamate-1-semialdehyde 2,1-aminomutase